ncbi:MAG: efflux RND transporter periplasmic adaptor subunit [Burkholderiaceae bacterium]
MNELRLSRYQRDGVRRRPHGWLLALGVLVLAAMLSAAAWQWLERRAPAVQTAVVVAAGGGSTLLQATGYVVARRQATVSAQITGMLTRVLVKEGDRVKSGQLLARLEDSTARANVAAAQANAQAAESQVALLQVQLAQAQADESRLRALADSGLVTQQAAEQARTQVAILAAQLHSRRKDAEAAQAQAAQAHVHYAHTYVRAPFDGVVTALAAQAGEIVSPLSSGGGFTRTGILTIVDMDTLEVEVEINEAQIAQIRPAMPVEIVLESYPDLRLPAQVVAAMPIADRSKGTVKIRVRLLQKDERILPNLRARANFLGQQPVSPTPADGGVLIPAQAVVQREGSEVVFVVDEGRVQQRRIRLAERQAGQTRLVSAGLKAGEKVVLAPPMTLQDGMQVRLQQTAR